MHFYIFYYFLLPNNLNKITFFKVISSVKKGTRKRGGGRRDITMSFKNQVGRTNYGDPKYLALGRRKMGANNYFIGQETSASSSSPKKPHVIAFHSSSKWKIHFEASKESDKLMVMYFTATWCKPCHFMEPAINDLAAKFSNVEFVKIDVDELLGVSEEFGVQGLPTFILTKGGKQLDKVVGARKDDLLNKIHKHIIT